MQVVFVAPTHEDALTEGEVYEVLNNGWSAVRVENDNGYKRWYPADYFEVVL